MWTGSIRSITMIFTLTLNPAIDYVMTLPSFSEGAVNRSAEEELFFGGKGINVSIILSRLGIPSTALGFTAGFTGAAIEQGLSAQGISTDFIRLPSGNSRINVKLKSTQETEINGSGPSVSQKDLDLLFHKLNTVQSGDFLVIAGSVPASLPSGIYEQILSRLSGKGILFAVDAAGSLLTKVLKYRPFLIKPNHIELGELFQTEITTPQQAAEYAAELQKRGAVNVLVSMAEQGCILIDETGTVTPMKAPAGKVINSVGAGDSALAGFLAGYLSRSDYPYALALATAAGSATAFSKDLADKEHIQRLLEEVTLLNSEMCKKKC